MVERRERELLETAPEFDSAVVVGAGSDEEGGAVVDEALVDVVVVVSSCDLVIVAFAPPSPLVEEHRDRLPADAVGDKGWLLLLVLVAERFGMVGGGGDDDDGDRSVSLVILFCGTSFLEAP